MADDMERAKALAEKIQQTVNDALAGIDRRMTVMGWPEEFQYIMWNAVAAEAINRAGRKRK